MNSDKVITIAFGLCFAVAMFAVSKAQQLSGGGGGVPGGSTTQVQFNNAGVFAGNSAVVINNTNSILAFGGVTASFPGIKSSASALGLDRLAVRLANDSDWTYVGTKGFDLMNSGSTRTAYFIQSGGHAELGATDSVADLFLNANAGGTSKVRISGVLGTTTASPTISNGANNNVPTIQSRVRVTGPTGAFSISGFTNGYDGAVLYLYNSTAQAMTLTNDATSTAANRILTLTGADVVLAASVSSAMFSYDATAARWILMSARDSAGAH